MPYTKDGIGYQNTDTSMMSAIMSAHGYKTIREQVRFIIMAAGPVSVEAISDLMLIDECTIQPRTSELRNDGIIKDSGMREKSKHGKYRIMWQIVDKSI